MKLTFLIALTLIAAQAEALELGLQINSPGAAAAPNYEAGGYTSSRLGGGYTVLTPVSGPGRIVDNDRPSVTIHQGGSAAGTLPPLSTGDDEADSRRRMDWLMNQ